MKTKFKLNKKNIYLIKDKILKFGRYKILLVWDIVKDSDSNRVYVEFRWDYNISCMNLNKFLNRYYSGKIVFNEDLKTINERDV